MEATKTIQVPLHELRKQKPITVEGSFIELYPDKLRWFAEFEAEEYPLNSEGEEDTSMPKEAVPNFYDITVYKKYIAGIFAEFSNYNHLFKVTIMCDGCDTDVSLYFKSKSKALALKEELIEWMG